MFNRVLRLDQLCTAGQGKRAQKLSPCVQSATCQTLDPFLMGIQHRVGLGCSQLPRGTADLRFLREDAHASAAVVSRGGGCRNTEEGAAAFGDLSAGPARVRAFVEFMLGPFRSLFAYDIAASFVSSDTKKT